MALTRRRASREPRLLACGAFAGLLVAWAPVGAADPAPPMGAELVKPGLYRVAGPGAGTVVRLSADGPIVVDANRAGTYEALIAAIQRLAKRPDAPVRAVILTAAGPEQAGNVPRFADAGVPVVVSTRALGRLAQGERGSGGQAGVHKPPLSYDAGYVLQSGGVQVEVEHVGSGRTGADSVAYFRDLRVVAVGELYTHGTPQPDCASGGSLAGWAAAITHMLYFDFDVAVPSKGAPVGKRELVEFKEKLEKLAQGEDCRRH